MWIICDFIQIVCISLCVCVWVGDCSSGQGRRELVRAPLKIIFRAPRQGLTCKDENYRNKADSVLRNMAPGRKCRQHVKALSHSTGKDK